MTTTHQDHPAPGEGEPTRPDPAAAAPFIGVGIHVNDPRSISRESGGDSRWISFQGRDAYPNASLFLSDDALVALHRVLGEEIGERGLGLSASEWLASVSNLRVPPPEPAPVPMVDGHHPWPTPAETAATLADARYEAETETEGDPFP